MTFGCKTLMWFIYLFFKILTSSERVLFKKKKNSRKSSKMAFHSFNDPPFFHINFLISTSADATSTWHFVCKAHELIAKNVYSIVYTWTQEFSGHWKG